jgi:hypothetical protein
MCFAIGIAMILATPTGFESTARMSNRLSIAWATLSMTGALRNPEFNEQLRNRVTSRRRAAGAQRHLQTNWIGCIGSWLLKLAVEHPELKSVWHELSNSLNGKVRFRVACFINELPRPLANEIGNQLKDDRHKKTREMAQARLEEIGT